MFVARKVPTLSFSNYGNPETRSVFSKALFEAITEFGFVVIKDHGIDPQQFKQAYTLAESLFAQPLETKLKYDGGDLGQRGYIAFGRERAKGNPHPDLKEYWHVGPELDDSHPYKGDYPENFWPSEVPEFKACYSSLYQQLGDLSVKLLECLGEEMGQPAGYFADMVKYGNSIQRLIHYPPLTGLDTGDAIRAAAHADINLMTLLVGATDAGLELQDRDGSWLPVEHNEGEIVMDTGDMMALLTNGQLPSTIHRVVNPEDVSKPRFSIPFFVHPENNFLLSPLPQFSKGSQSEARSITAGDFLHERLRENGFPVKS